ncbi:hypothetical protein AB3M94_13365 [Peribacillus frigoritolerans]
MDTTNTELAKRMGFERTDKYMYSKSVKWDEVEIFEERKPYTLDQFPDLKCLHKVKTDISSKSGY